MSLALVTIGAVVLFFTPVLGVRSVRVEGARTLDEGRVRQVAAIDGGTPLVRLDRSGVLRRVSGISRVDSASLRISLPSTVVVSVSERQPVLFADTSDGYRLVDDEGVGFATVTERPGDLPEFRAAPDLRAKRARTAAVTVVTALHDETLGEVGAVRAVGGSGSPRIRLSLTGGRTVEWGGVERSGRKADILPVLLSRPGEVYDVTSPELPTVS